MSDRIISRGQMRRLMSEFADHIPDDMNFDLAQEWGDDLHKVLPVILRNYKPWDVLMALEGLSVSKEIVVEKQPTCPANNEIFELIVVDPATGLEVVRHFKLIWVGFQRNWKSLQRAVNSHGSPTGELECAAFKKKFPCEDGKKSPIGFITIPPGYAEFPFVGEVDAAAYNWSVYGFRPHWRWCVGVRVLKP